MQCATHGAIKVMVLHEEVIAIRASAPSETHMRAYMAAVGGKPSRPQAPLLEGEGESHLPAVNPHLGGKTLHHLQADLGNLADQELCQLMEDPFWEVALCQLNAPPRSPPPTPWGNPTGSGDPNADDQEVTFPREGGWVPPGQPYQPPAPTWPDGGWAPQGPPPQPPTPAEPNADVGHLINTSALGLHLGTMRINTFSREATPGSTF